MFDPDTRSWKRYTAIDCKLNGKERWSVFVVGTWPVTGEEVVVGTVCSGLIASATAECCGPLHSAG